MANNKCQAQQSSCEKVQSAICLHCNHRLCLQHIIEHEQIIIDDDIKNLSNLIEETLQQIKDKSEESRIACDNQLSKYNQWRIEQLEQLEKIYENELQMIATEDEILKNFYKYLLECIEQNARQPLERVKRQQNTSLEIVNHVRENIEKIRQESKQLKWRFSTSLPDNTKCSSSTNINELKIALKASLKKRKSSSTLTKPGQISPPKQLVQLFATLSTINQSKTEIDVYIRKCDTKLFLIVNSYLTACHQKSSADEKLILLNRHISTIQKYLTNQLTEFDILIGIQTFLFKNEFCDDKSDLMKFLLEFFLHHQCITQNVILNWYNSVNEDQYEGFEEAKQLAKPFIEKFCQQSKSNFS